MTVRGESDEESAARRERANSYTNAIATLQARWVDAYTAVYSYVTKKKKQNAQESKPRSGSTEGPSTKR